MRMTWVGGVVLGMSSAVACAQNHPIDTKPEGQQKQCTYSVTAGDGQTVTGTKACSGEAAPTDTPIAKRLPYPGDPAPAEAPLGPESPVAPAEPGSAAGSSPAGPLRDAGSSGESSSSSSTSSSNAASVPAEGPPPDPDDVNSDTPVAPKRNLHKKPVFSMEKQPIAEQEANDLQIAGFYMNDGNWRGAYGRAADAVKLVDEDPGAHLALANAARKLGKLDEAVKEYKRTLALDPVPKARKEAEKALKEMSGDQ